MFHQYSLVVILVCLFWVEQNFAFQDSISKYQSILDIKSTNLNFSQNWQYFWCGLFPDFLPTFNIFIITQIGDHVAQVLFSCELLHNFVIHSQLAALIFSRSQVHYIAFLGIKIQFLAFNKYVDKCIHLHWLLSARHGGKSVIYHSQTRAKPYYFYRASLKKVGLVNPSHFVLLL
jgi:hypothetical protein